MDPVIVLRQRERLLAARYGADHAPDPLDGQDLQSADVADAQHWVQVYSELVEFLCTLSGPSSEGQPGPGGPARDLQQRRAMRLERKVHELHLAFWNDRLRRLRREYGSESRGGQGEGPIGPGRVARPRHCQGVAVEKTWDGLPISPEPPHGAAVAVWRRSSGGVEWLVLHKNPAHRDGADLPGEWEWGCPSGSRFPGERLETCASRELEEETGLRLRMRLAMSDPAWPFFVAEAPRDASVRLSEEHDAHRWVSLEEATASIRPAFVASQFERAARSVSTGTG